MFYMSYSDFCLDLGKKADTREVIGKKLKTLKNVEKKRAKRDGKLIYIISGIRLL